MSDYLASDFMLKRALLIVGLFIGTLILAYESITQGSLGFGLALPGIFIVLFFLQRPVALFMTALVVWTMGLRFPGLPAAIGLPVLLQFLLIGWALINRSLKQGPPSRLYARKADVLIVMFGMNLVLLMFIHGSGFARFGGTVIGGTYYLGVLIGIGFYLAAVNLQFSDQNIKVLIWSMMIASMVPAVVQVGSTYAPGAFQWMAKFVNTRALENVAEDGLGPADTIQRWSGLSLLAYALIPVAFILIQRRWLKSLMILSSFAMIGMTGFRSRMIQIAIMTVACGIYFSKDRKMAILKYAVAGTLLLASIFAFADALPRSAQRALCFIPGLSVPADIAANAESSSNMRFVMWKDYCLPNVPNYLLIGRGLARDIQDYAWLQGNWYGSLEFFYYMGNYHSGPFSLLLDHGLFGTFTFVMFFILIATDAWRTLRRHSHDASALYAKYYAYLTILMTWKILEFIFVFGDVRTGLLSLLTVAAQLKIIQKNFRSSPDRGADILDRGANPQRGMS